MSESGNYAAHLIPCLPKASSPAAFRPESKTFCMSSATSFFASMPSALRTPLVLLLVSLYSLASNLHSFVGRLRTGKSFSCCVYAFIRDCKSRVRYYVSHSVSGSVHPSIRPSVHPSISPSICLFIGLSVHLSVHLTVCLLVYDRRTPNHTFIGSP